MARIKIKLPATFSFTCTIPIRITDINYGGHVGNDRILSLIHEARVQFLEHHGYQELAVEGLGLIMSDVAIEFKAELFYSDNITISVSAGDFTRIGFDIYYLVEKITNEKKINAVSAKTGMICYDYSLKKVAAVPDVVRSKLLL